MKLDIEEWKPFITSRLFPVMENGKANQQMLVEGTECFYVGAKKNDNGVMVHCQRDEDLITKGNCVVFICNGQGSVGFANYMDVDFIGTTDIVAGYNEKLNEHIGAFLATIYSQERPKYSFGRKWKTHLKDTEVKLPVQHNDDGSYVNDATCQYSDEGFVPDWQFMEDYIKSLHFKPLTTNHTVAFSLNKDKWEEFAFGRLISVNNIYKAHAYTKDDLDEKDIKLSSTLRYITRTAEDNGCELIVKNEALSYVEEGNAITIGDTTATCFYQEEKFVTGDHMIVVRANWLNTYTGLFIVTLLNNEQYRYSYGRAFLMDRVKETILKLPICRNNDGSPIIDETKQFSDEGYIPDWQFMEDYIKSLPYGDRI